MTQPDKLKIVYLHPDALTPNEWNPNVMSAENEDKLAESMSRNTLFDALLARRLPDGRIQLLGGEHRWRISKRLNMPEVPVIVLDRVDDDRAKEISLAHNARYGADDALKMSDLIHSLQDSDILSEILPYSDTDIDSLMSAVEIDLDSLSLLDDDDPLDAKEEKPAPTHTVLRFKVSLEDAAEIQALIADAMDKNGFNHSDSLTNAGDALAHLLLN